METQLASEVVIATPLSRRTYASDATGLPLDQTIDSQIDVVPRPRHERLNRLFNVLASCAILLLASPLLLLVAFLVRITSRGPIFYRQTRIGLDRRRRSTGIDAPLYDRRAYNLGGRPFSILKFRSMTANAEARSGVVWAQKHDARVTPFGRVLRKTRLDELPQLLNVLRGDMNIVGPRPERPSIFGRLRQDIREYELRQRAKPGITGLAQINHSYDSCVDDVRVKVRYDLEYLRRQSLVEDLRIMLLTVPVIILRRGGW